MNILNIGGIPLIYLGDEVGTLNDSSFTKVRNLAADGWSAPVDDRVRLRVTPDIHWRIWPFWFVYIKEQVALQGDPDFARITVRREVIIPWRQYLP
jgi:hypothetical protein